MSIRPTSAGALTVEADVSGDDVDDGELDKLAVGDDVGVIVLDEGELFYVSRSVLFAPVVLEGVRGRLSNSQ